jgi:competence protein CoiA
MHGTRIKPRSRDSSVTHFDAQFSINETDLREIDQIDKMKFALINGEKTEATKGARGFCPSCGSELIARCGEVKVNHWAHKGNRNCDPWWENETDWHRYWKGQFPDDWQEVIHRDDKGEKHIADVKTDRDWVIEFQHSYIKPEERHSRESFYKKLIWVVDGARRKRDRDQFSKALNSGSLVKVYPHMRRIFADGCVLLQEWLSSESRVFFDFREGGRIWWLLSKGFGTPVYVMPIPSIQFISDHLGQTNQFDELERLAEELAVNTERLLAQSR